LRKSELAYRKVCGTPPQPLLFGLHAALQLTFAEGIDQVLQRHRLLSSMVHAAVARWSVAGQVGFFAPSPQARSASVTAITVKRGVDVDALRTVARERFQVALAGGLGPLNGRVFRIGHLGDINAPMVLGCLAGLQAAMAVQGIAFGAGALDAATEVLSRG
jgi:alanine-glyoxylate transaminase/serine-glyoxylate transaminase/serine-pyruvate transaminase